MTCCHQAQVSDKPNGKNIVNNAAVTASQLICARVLAMLIMLFVRWVSFLVDCWDSMLSQQVRLWCWLMLLILTDDNHCYHCFSLCSPKKCIQNMTSNPVLKPTFHCLAFITKSHTFYVIMLSQCLLMFLSCVHLFLKTSLSVHLCILLTFCAYAAQCVSLKVGKCAIKKSTCYNKLV